MKLSIIDRVIITHAILPETGNIEQIKLKMSVKNKLKLLDSEVSSLSIKRDQYNYITIDNITEEIVERVKDFDLTLDEIKLIKEFCNFNNNNGWVTESSLDTVEYIINYTIEE